MKRVAKFQEGGDVAMTAAERRRQNMQRLNERRSASRMSASERAEVERFNERMRQGTLTPDDMRRMGGRSDIERFSERAQRGTLTADDMRRMGGTPTQQAAPAPSMQDVVRPARPGEAPRRPADAMRDAVRPVGPSAGRSAPRGPGIAGAAGTLLALGPAAMEAYNAYRNRPITGEFERSMDPEGSNEAADAERERQASQRAPDRPAAPAPDRPAARPAPRRPAPREMSAEERRAFMERTMREEADREAAARQSERGFFERLGLRRTNETGMEPGTIEQRRNYLGSGAADTNVSYNKKGGLLKAKAPMKKGGKAMMYREGGKVRQGMQSPKAQEARAEMAEDVMRRERAREPISDKERKAGRAEAAMDSGPLTDAEKERMRSSGFKKGGMIKPKAKTAMKKGGAVKAPAKKMKSGGKVAPKKMMKGGMTSKPKKMMGGGRAMYAKGGMAKGCK
jgi:hypothetical protein